MTPDEMNPAICSSALEEDGTLDRSKWDGAHRWDDSTTPITCAECGTEKDADTAPGYVDYTCWGVRELIAELEKRDREANK